MGRIMRLFNIARLHVSNVYWNVHARVRSVFNLQRSTGVHRFRDIPIELIDNPQARDISSELPPPYSAPVEPIIPDLPPPVEYMRDDIKCIKKELNVFGKVQKVGKGSFGKVFVGFDRSSPVPTSSQAQSTMPFRKCAIKVLTAKKLLKLEHESDAYEEELINFGEIAANEIRFLSELNHPNIIEYYECAVMNHQTIPAPTKVMLKMEFMDISLEDLLEQSKGCMTMEEVKPLALQIGCALLHLKEQGIVHHDVKPGNIMVNCIDQMEVKAQCSKSGKRVFSPNNRFKLIDFGFARRYQACSRGCLVSLPCGGTFHFLPPEMKENGRLSRTAFYNPYLNEAYAFGATLLCALEGWHKFDGKDLESKMLSIFVNMQKSVRPLEHTNGGDTIKPGMIGAAFAIKTLVANNMDRRSFITSEVLKTFDY